MIEKQSLGSLPIFFLNTCPILRRGKFVDDPDGMGWAFYAIVPRKEAIEAVEREGFTDDDGEPVKLDAPEARIDWMGPGAFYSSHGVVTDPSDPYYHHRKRLCNSDFASALTGWTARDCNGPGQAFYHAPVIRCFGDKLLIVWRGGLDV